MKKFQGGGGVPRQTTIGGQRHDLAYINPFEADLLRAYGGSGEPGPGGIPAYRVYDGSYNPSTISRDRTQSTASISQQQRQEMDREINRPASSPRPDRTDPNRPSPAEQVARANAQANAERARQQAQAAQARQRAQQADRQREQQMRAREAAAAEARRKQAEQSRREAAALAARNAARAEEERKEAARIARVQREAAERQREQQEAQRREIERLKKEAEERARIQAEAQRAREEAARIAQAQEDARITKAREEARKAKVIASAPDSGGVTSVYQGPRPPVRPSVGEAAAEGPTEATGIFSGLPNMVDMLKGAAGDVTMGYYAGFGDPATQRANLIAAGYSEAEAQAYLDRTAATIARNEAAAQGGTRSGDDSSPAPIDPCPEGYRMDTATNACVPSDDVTDAAPEPGPDPVTPFPGITPPISTVPTVVGSPNYTQIESPFTLPPLTPGGTPGILPMPDFGVAAADRGFMPTTYGGMPTDVDPFR